MHLDFSSLIVFNRPASWRKLLPEHGTTGQALVKKSANEGDVGWGDVGGGPGGAPAGTGYVHVTGGVYDTPAAITKGDVGLSNADNTSDFNKPISTATQSALDGKDAAGAAAAAQAAAASDATTKANAAQAAAISAAASDATTKANAAQAAAIAASDPSGAAATVQGNLNTHAGLSTTAHGGIVANTDSRLSDARAPTAHAIGGAAHSSDTLANLQSKISDATIETTTGSAAKVSTHDGLAAPHSGATSVGGKSIPSGGFADAGTLSTHVGLTTTAHGGIVASNDARLTDARAPTLHSITDQTKHSSTATAGQMLKADANGLPINASNTDAAVAAAVTASHSNANDPTAAEKASFQYPTIFVPNSQRVFRSMTDVATGGFLTISGTAYFVYMGRVGPAAITPVAVRAYLRVLAVTLTVAEAGIFSTPSAPNFAASQVVSKLAAVATWDSLTAGLGAKKSGALSTSVAAGTHLWAGFRAQFSTMPNFTGLIYDNRSGEILVTAGAAAFSTSGPWTGVLVAAQSAATPVACCPELMLTLD